MRDRELVRRCIAGEEEGWGTLVRRHTPVVTEAVRQVLSGVGLERDPGRVDDLVSRVFERLLENDCRRLREFRGECALSTWLYLAASRLTRNRLREEGRERLHLEEILKRPDPRAEPSSPLQTLSDREQIEWIRKGLDSLPEEERTLLLDLYLRNHSYEEMARTRRVPVGTLSTRLIRVRKKLWSFLKGKLSILLL